jgi:hypothetical protein
LAKKMPCLKGRRWPANFAASADCGALAAGDDDDLEVPNGVAGDEWFDQRFQTAGYPSALKTKEEYKSVKGENRL